jgi:inner membrane protein
LDSVTQAVLGASVAGICAPPDHRRKALLMGAALGTLPDLDVLIDYGDPVANFTYHRGFSHSLFVLFPFSVIVWLILRTWWAPVRDRQWRWFAAIMLTLVTHPLLDAHTVYGTQLFWPMTSPPVMWSTLFIIDPLYTLPLLVGSLFAAVRPAVKTSRVLLTAGLIISSTYIGWSWIAKTIVEREASAALSVVALDGAPRFSIPTPFNTLLWRVVVLTDDGYLEGYSSLLIDDSPMRFQAYTSDVATLRATENIWAVARLRWFAHDFLKSEVKGDKLVLTDLRMGAEPKYIFSHTVARRGNPHWQAIPPERISTTIYPSDLLVVWQRLWDRDEARNRQ